MKKMGFTAKMSKETIFYIVILILIVVFIFNMKNVYSFIGKIRNGELFKTEEKNNDDSETPSDDDDNNEQDEYVVLEPIGRSSMTCEKTTSDTNGDKATNVKLYYTDLKLKSIVEEELYTGYTDEYTNYIYAEKSKYDRRKSLNLSNKGFSIQIELAGTSSLKVSSVYDLAKTSFLDISTDADDTIELYGSYDALLTDIREEYVNSGYDCEALNE